MLLGHINDVLISSKSIVVFQCRTLWFHQILSSNLKSPSFYIPPLLGPTDSMGLCVLSPRDPGWCDSELTEGYCLRATGTQVLKVGVHGEPAYAAPVLLTSCTLGVPPAPNLTISEG